MKSILAVSVLALAAGCASAPEQLAQAECKVAPITTASAAGVRKPKVDRLDQRWAEMQLGTSEYRMRQLRERGMVNNNVEDVLRDCY